MSPEDRASMDMERSVYHNSFIDSLNILSRNMVKSEEEASSFGKLGKDRKTPGDFACYIVIRNGIAMR